MGEDREDWHVRWFASGTMIVEDRASPHEAYEFGVRCLSPHLYVFGPGYGTDDGPDQAIRDRYRCCEELAAFLNGGPRPAWLDDLRRTSEAHAEDIDGTSVTATGPMVDRDPPKCDWINDPSPEAQDARARLMDRLGIPSAKGGA
jgi:hypothetical protein